MTSGIRADDRGSSDYLTTSISASMEDWKSRMQEWDRRTNERLDRLERMVDTWLKNKNSPSISSIQQQSAGSSLCLCPSSCCTAPTVVVSVVVVPTVAVPPQQAPSSASASSPSAVQQRQTGQPAPLQHTLLPQHQLEPCVPSHNLNSEEVAAPISDSEVSVMAPKILVEGTPLWSNKTAPQPFALATERKRSPARAADDAVKKTDKSNEKRDYLETNLGPVIQTKSVEPRHVFPPSDGTYSYSWSTCNTSWFLDRRHVSKEIILLTGADTGDPKGVRPNATACNKVLQEAQRARYRLCSAFVPGNRYALVGTRSGSLEIVDVGSGTTIDVVEAHTGQIKSIRPIPDEDGSVSGNGFVTGADDNDVKFWEYQLVQRHGHVSYFLA